MAPSWSDADVLAARRNAAKAHLAESVAALESIRLDPLRLHAGASDLVLLTTLMDAATPRWRGLEPTRGGPAGDRGRRRS